MPMGKHKIPTYDEDPELYERIWGAFSRAMKRDNERWIAEAEEAERNFWPTFWANTKRPVLKLDKEEE